MGSGGGGGGGAGVKWPEVPQYEYDQNMFANFDPRANHAQPFAWNWLPQITGPQQQQQAAPAQTGPTRMPGGGYSDEYMGYEPPGQYNQPFLFGSNVQMGSPLGAPNDEVPLQYPRYTNY